MNLISYQYRLQRRHLTIFNNKEQKSSSTLKKMNFPFVRFIGQNELKLALCLTLVDPNIGGVLILGDRGTGKSVIARSLVDILPEIEVVPDDPFNSSPTEISLMGPDVLTRFRSGETIPSMRSTIPFVELPLGATEDKVCGTIDIEKALQEGVKALAPGLVGRANRGILYVDEINLLDDGLVDVILDSAGGGVHTVEREGVSIIHPAKFILIGSGATDEGEIRPQMLDRFGLSVNVSTLTDVDQRTQLVLNRMSYEANPESYVKEAIEETVSIKNQLLNAAERLKVIKLPRGLQIKISDLCAKLGIDGLRGDLVANRAAKALSAFEYEDEVKESTVERVITLCLGHRLRACPLDTMEGGARVSSVWARIKSTETSSERYGITGEE